MSETFITNDTVLHISGDGTMIPAANTAEYWSEKQRPELPDGHLLSVFRYERNWDYVERHPEGDELAAVVAGAADLVLDEGAGERSLRLGAGTGAVVPAGAWHRLVVHRPATVLFITPNPAATEHRSLTA